MNSFQKINENSGFVRQLDEWMNGFNYHILNDELVSSETKGSTCVPDFSCCIKDVKTPIATKLEFKNAFLSGDEDKVNEMLVGFLGNAIPDVSILNIDEMINDEDYKDLLS